MHNVHQLPVAGKAKRPEFARFMTMAEGNPLHAKILETVYYWCINGREDNRDGYRYCTQKNEWIAEEVGCSVRTVEKVFQMARDKELVWTRGFKFQGEHRRKTRWTTDPFKVAKWRADGEPETVQPDGFNALPETAQPDGLKPSSQTVSKPPSQTVSKYNDHSPENSKTHDDHCASGDFSGKNDPCGSGAGPLPEKALTPQPPAPAPEAAPEPEPIRPEWCPEGVWNELDPKKRRGVADMVFVPGKPAPQLPYGLSFSANLSLRRARDEHHNAVRAEAGLPPKAG